MLILYILIISDYKKAQNMGFSFFPKTVKFFELFTKQYDLVKQSSIVLYDLFSNFSDIPSKCSQISELESQGNEISNEITRQLSLSFITPIDREDIHGINNSQESLLNSIKAISSRVGFYQAKNIPQGAIELLSYLKEIIFEVENMLNKINQKKEADIHHAKIKGIKYQSDLLLLVSLGEIYEKEIDDKKEIKEILIWSQIYDRIEHALQAADILSNTLEGVSLKNA